MRYALLVLLMLAAFVDAAPTRAQGRGDCELVLWRAQRQYDNSRFREVIGLFETCPPENIADEKQRIEAYKLLALAWIGEERTYKAREYAEKIRELDPLYEPDEAEFSRYYLELFKPSDAKQEISVAFAARDEAVALAEVQAARASAAEQRVEQVSLQAAEADSLARLARIQADAAKQQADSLDAIALLAKEEARRADSLRADAALRASLAEAEADSAEARADRARRLLASAETEREEANEAAAVAAERLAAALTRAELAEATARAAEHKLVLRRRRIVGAAVGAGLIGGAIAWIVKPPEDQSLPVPPAFPSPTN
ncbi:MAG: hypothetical protein R2834_02175 [Rhodothermales bacterium]